MWAMSTLLGLTPVSARLLDLSECMLWFIVLPLAAVVHVWHSATVASIFGLFLAFSWLYTDFCVTTVVWQWVIHLLTSVSYIQIWYHFFIQSLNILTANLVEVIHVLLVRDSLQLLIIVTSKYCEDTDCWSEGGERPSRIHHTKYSF